MPGPERVVDGSTPHARAPLRAARLRESRLEIGTTMLHRTTFASLFVVLASLSCRTQPATRVVPGGEPRRWQHEVSDIPVDPRIRFGSLANGMRYAWMANAEPHERCYVRLHVDAGSLAETDDEQGIAHFLEHMAFNGTRDYPGTTLVEWFQRHGMGFGADSNASTSFSETIYELDLPRSDAEMLGEGLHVLRQFTDALTLDPKEVEDEKGVIDAEERERDSAAWRAQKEQLQRLLAGTRVAERLPVGVREVRQRFTAEKIRAFWQHWYRPDLMTLVVVGDLGDLDPTAAIEAAFASLPRPSTPRPAEPPLGTPTFAETTFAIHAPELPTESISLQRLIPWREEPATVANWTKDLALEHARDMLDLRFSEIAKRADATFLGANAGDAEILRVADGEELSVGSQPERWRDALATCTRELRRALEFGFQPAELDEIRANELRGLAEAVQREGTRKSTDYAAEILSAAEDPTVPADSKTLQAILAPAIEALTVEQCAEAFRTAWSQGTQTLTAVGSLDLGPQAADELRAALEAATATPLEAPAAITAATFDYPAAETPAPVASRTRHAEIDTEEIRFANGVRLLAKKTDFQQRQILLELDLGEGQLTIAPSQAALGWVLPQVFEAGGLGRHSQDDLRRIFAGKDVSASFGVSESAFVLRGSTSPEDLLLECQLLTAYVADPGWRPEGFGQFQRQLPELYAGLEHQLQGPLVLEFLPALYGGDTRFGLPPRAEVEAVTLDQLRDFMTPIEADAPITLTVVGDVDLAALEAAVGRTLGRLPARRELRRLDEARRLQGPRPGLRMQRTIESQVAKALVIAMFPTSDGLDPVRRRNLAFLGEVYNDRLRVEVREKLGASYSPQADSVTSTTYPGDGAIRAQAIADPAGITALRDTCLAVARDLARTGVTDEEVERLRSPLLNQLRDARRQNGFWLAQISDAHSREEALKELVGAEEHYKKTSAADLSPLAKKWLEPERAAVLVVQPK
jgi:zinc protease